MVERGMGDRGVARRGATVTNRQIGRSVRRTPWSAADPRSARFSENSRLSPGLLRTR